MYRQLVEELSKWRTSQVRKPLVLMGARQVGKTYLLKKFGTQFYDNVVYLNFDLNKSLCTLFAGDLEPKDLLRIIALHTKTKINPGTTLIIFDEIQECPNALISLKYFNEFANEYHICAAGSLLGVKLLNTKGFPVGKVNLLHLYPLDFYEFLTAIQETELLEYLNEISIYKKIPEIIHTKLTDLLKEYMIVGGMPEAVKSYIADIDRNLNEVRIVQQEILKTYNLDFSKHAPVNMIMKISQVWDAIPSQLVKENKKFIYSVIRSGARAKDFEDAIQWLVEANLICKTYNLSTPHLPLSAYTSQDIFKLYMFDVGLYGAVANLDPIVIIERDLLFREFKGSMAETYVAQTLHKMELGRANRDLHYWTSAGRAEVDFVIEHRNQVYPIEVKSGTSTKQKSLNIYAQKYKPRLLVRTSAQNLEFVNNFLNVPLYLLPKLKDLIDQS